jgi:amino acid transporter
VTTSAGLERVVSRWQIVGISLNAVIGSGVYLVPAAAAALLGPASLWAVALAGLAVLLLALCFAEAGSHFAEPGAGYIYTRAAFGEFIGFQVGWMTWLARIAGGAALWAGLAQTLTFVSPAAAAGFSRVAVITVPLVLLTVINIAGVKYAARLEVIFAIAKIFPLLFFVAVGIPAIDASLIVPMAAPDPAGLGAAASLLLFAYAGFENTAAAAGEFKNPQRDVPFALIISIVAITLLYTLVQLVALGTLPDLAARTEGAALADSITRTVGVWAGVILTLGAVVSIGGNIGNTVLVGPRYLFAMATSGFGPAALARIHPRFHTPAWAIAAQAVVTGALALSGSFVQLAMLSIIARLATYIGTAAAVPVLRRRLTVGEHTIVLPGGATIPILALLVCLAFLASATTGNLIAGGIALLAGAAVYFFRHDVASTDS